MNNKQQKYLDRWHFIITWVMRLQLLISLGAIAFLVLDWDRHGDMYHPHIMFTAVGLLYAWVACMAIGGLVAIPTKEEIVQAFLKDMRDKENGS